MSRTELFPMNVQFFAEDGAGSTGAGDNGAGDSGAGDAGAQTTGAGSASGATNGTGTQNQTGTGEKTFTQADLTATATREKNQGKNSVFKLFGVADEKEARAKAELFKKWDDEQKTIDQKRAEAEKVAASNEARAQMAENKLACVEAGVNKDSLDDALAIAVLKVTDGKDLAAVLAEMKAQPKYKGFFDEGVGSRGTGNPANHAGSGLGGKDNIGKRLAEKAASTQPKKSSYF